MTTSPGFASSIARTWNDCSGNLILSPFLRNSPVRRSASNDSKRARRGVGAASVTKFLKDPAARRRDGLPGGLKPRKSLAPLITELNPITACLEVLILPGDSGSNACSSKAQWFTRYAQNHPDFTRFSHA